MIITSVLNNKFNINLWRLNPGFKVGIFLAVREEYYNKNVAYII